jgi:type I restriction enzyme S subunit
MNSQLTLNKAAIYSEDRINGSKISRDNFVTTDSMLQNKKGLSTTPVLPKGNLIAFLEGDILIGNIRPYLKKIWYANRKGGCSPDVLVLRAKPKIVPKFLYYSLFRDDFFNHMMKGSKGTKMPRGDKNQILRFHVPEIDFIEQQKIASVLSVLDSKIEVNNRINAELEAMAKTLYDYWFVQFDFPDANGKPYKTRGGKMVWNEKLKREFPEGWGVLRLDQIIKIRNGFAFKSEDYKDSGVPIVRTKNFNEVSIELDDVVYLSIDKAKEFKEFYLRRFDFLVVMVGASVGKSVVVPSYILPALQNQNMWNFLPKKESQKLYSNFLISKVVDEQLKTAIGSARSFFRKDHFYGVEVAVPDDSVIEDFENLVTPIFEKIDLNISENQTLKTLRDWLLPMLMNGQVKVN